MPHLLVMERPAFRDCRGGNRAVIDCTYSGKGSGACLRSESVGAVYDRPNQERAVIDCTYSANGFLE